MYTKKMLSDASNGGADSPDASAEPSAEEILDGNVPDPEGQPVVTEDESNAAESNGEEFVEEAVEEEPPDDNLKNWRRKLTQQAQEQARERRELQKAREELERLRQEREQRRVPLEEDDLFEDEADASVNPVLEELRQKVEELARERDMSRQNQQKQAFLDEIDTVAKAFKLDAKRLTGAVWLEENPDKTIADVAQELAQDDARARASRKPVRQPAASPKILDQTSGGFKAPSEENLSALDDPVTFDEVMKVLEGSGV